MPKFNVHYWKDGRNGSVEIEASTPDDAKAQFKKRYPKAEIVKTKRVRS